MNIKSIENNGSATGERRDALVTALKISGAKNGKYNLKKSDEAKGFFFEVDGVKVPFTVLFNDNDKTEGILGVCFGTARDCPSKALRLCQLPTDRICYAQAGEGRATRRENEDGSKGMDSYLNGVLCGVFWDEFALSDDLKYKLVDYLNAKGVDTLRFNLKGDFRHEVDALCIYWLACRGFHLTGYTARDDLSQVLEPLGDCDGVILNGSNRPYTNRFKATTSISEYLNAPYRCLGSCSDCRKCYTLRGVEIVVLVHGAGSDTLLNTEENRALVTRIFKNGAGQSLFEPKDFEQAKGLLTCINKTFKNLGFGFQFEDRKHFLNFLRKDGGL